MTNKLTLIEKIIHTQNDVLLQYIEELLENEVAKESIDTRQDPDPDTAHLS